jgi:hypothetical protein
MFTEELRRKRVDGAKVLHNVLKAQSHIGFCDVITGDESWIFLNIGPSSIWIGADEPILARPKLRKTHTHSVLAHQKGCSYQLAHAVPVIQQCLLQSRSDHPACSHA